MTVANSQASYDGLLMLCSPIEARQRVLELRAFVESVMVEGVDFGIIPGTGGKPTLYQPGAQKLAEMYGFAHRFLEIHTVRNWEAGFFYFEVRTELTTRADGRFVGEGVGSCNSREKGFAQRWVYAREVPAGVDFASLPTRKTKSGDPQYAVPNDDPFTLVNSIHKRACKRSFVHAVIAVTRSSGLFTQDRDDIPAEAFGVVDEERPWERPAPASVNRDHKPENAISGATPSEPVAQGHAEMTPKERELVAAIGPRFDEAMTHESRDAVCRRAVAAGGKNATRAYQDWYVAQKNKVLARLGPRPARGPRAGGPGPTKAQAPATGGKAAAS